MPSNDFYIAFKLPFEGPFEVFEIILEKAFKGLWNAL